MSCNPTGFTKPLQLLQTTPEGLVLDEHTAEVVARIKQPVVVVAIAGKYRTGKSYILNLLCELPRGSGFALGSTVESLTKGIWVYALPHPKLKDTVLVLLDTEGLGDVEKGDLTFDTTLLVLTILLSSTFILNVTGRLDDEVINQLSFVSTLTKSMKTKANEVETGENFDLFFPQLVILVRDFALQLIIGGREVTANDYFNTYCLQIKDESKRNAENYNKPRQLIRKYFPRRRCITLPMPVFNGRLLQDLENVPEDKLNPEFLENSAEFVKSILANSEPKCITEKARVNGEILITLLRTYLDQIGEGAVPCIETTLQSTARRENEILLSEFIATYMEKMYETLAMPSPLEFITEIHQSYCYHLAEEFKKRVIFDDGNNELETMCKREMNAAFQEMLRENEKASLHLCEIRLQDLSKKLMNNLKEKVYYKPGGYNRYSNDLHDIIERYNDIEEKTVMHEEVLCKFVSDRYREGNQIAALDEHMTETEKKLKAAHVEKQFAEQKAKNELEHAEQMKRSAEEIQKTFEQTQRQMESELKERNDKHDELRRLIAQSRTVQPTQPSSYCAIF